MFKKIKKAFKKIVSIYEEFFQSVEEKQEGNKIVYFESTKKRSFAPAVGRSVAPAVVAPFVASAPAVARVVSPAVAPVVNLKERKERKEKKLSYNEWKNNCNEYDLIRKKLFAY